MYVIVFRCLEYDTSRDNLFDLATDCVALGTTSTGVTATDEKSRLDAAEEIRKKFQLTSEHRDGIASWLRSASIGDVLLMPRTANRELGVAPDDIALVAMIGKPTISRLSVEEVTKVEVKVRVDKLPVGKKTIKK